MWVLHADRRILLDLFGGDPPRHLERLFRITSDPSALQTSEELLLIWSSEPDPSGRLFPFDRVRPSEERTLPDAIVVRPEKIRDFIAWATTVIGGYRPFTAFFRVIDQEQAAFALEPRQPTFGGLANAFIGLVIGEALTLSANQRPVSALSLLPCQSTYSFSFARAFALGYVQGGSTVDSISAPLALARRLTRQPARKLGDEILLEALNVVIGLAAGTRPTIRRNIPGFIWEACRELQAYGEVRKSWHLLEDRVGFSGDLLKEMRGPREHRVRTFERVLKAPTQLDALTTSFLAGLLADQIAPGTFEHVELLAPYLNQYPMALAWYGLCAGLHPDSEIQQVGNCLGRRLIRDLLVPDPVISRPKYDISVRELEVYLDREAPIDFRVGSNNHIAVELLPGVPAFMKWPVKDGASTELPPVHPRESSTLPPHKQRELAWRAPQLSIQVEEQAPVPGRQVLQAPQLSTTLEEQGSLAERQFAVRELDRAVDRIKSILVNTGRSGEGTPTHEGGGRKRRKGR